jgi:translation initiation factor 2 subunit 2
MQKNVTTIFPSHTPKETVSTNDQVNNLIHSSVTEYSYFEPLERIYQNKESPGDEKVEIPRPIVFKVGISRTLWVNFTRTANILNRNPRHFMDYTKIELCTLVNMDAEKRLLINGLFLAKHIHNIQNTYIQDYVICKNCKGKHTDLIKDNEIFYIKCKECHTNSHANSHANVRANSHANVGLKQGHVLNFTKRGL